MPRPYFPPISLSLGRGWSKGSPHVPHSPLLSCCLPKPPRLSSWSFTFSGVSNPYLHMVLRPAGCLNLPWPRASLRRAAVKSRRGRLSPPTLPPLLSLRPIILPPISDQGLQPGSSRYPSV